MIIFDHLCFGYSEQSELFSDLFLTLEEGNIYGLLGKNGAGKTSLLKLMCGLIFPQKGNVEFNGKKTQQRHPDFLKEIFFIPEEFYTSALTAIEYINLYSPFYSKFNINAFDEYLKEFEVDKDKKLSALSYGQKKKFLVAFGLAANTQLLILDEPTNGLDIPSKSQFRKLLAASIDDARSVIISTHQVRDMENLIDPIVILDNGKIVLKASVEAISKHLYFEKTFQEPVGDEVLYCEKVQGGFITVTENKTEQESILNLETLFNAVMNNPNKIQRLFPERGG